MPLKLFISYSHSDSDALDRLQIGLRPLERENLIAPWTDRLIDVGEDWRDKIRSALNECDLGLFLLSLDFLGSDFIASNELQPLLQREREHKIQLAPILLRKCDWENSPLGKLQPLPGYHNTSKTLETTKPLATKPGIVSSSRSASGLMITPTKRALRPGIKARIPACERSMKARR